jgi:hypothetical protein
VMCLLQRGDVTEIKALDATILISEIEPRETTKGKKYWLIKDGSKTFRTYSPKRAAAADALKADGKAAYIIYHEDHWIGREGQPMVTNELDELKPAKDGAQVDGPAPDEKMSKAEWDSKEDREHIRRLYVSHLIQMTGWWSSVPISDRELNYGEIVIEARKAAVRDLDWIRNYATKEAPL